MNYSSILRKAVYDMLDNGFIVRGCGCSRRIFVLNEKYIVKEIYNIVEEAGGTDLNDDSFNELMDFGKIENEVEQIRRFYNTIPQSKKKDNYYQGIPIAVYSMLTEHAVSNIMYKSGRGDLIARVLKVMEIEGTVYALCENAYEMKEVENKTHELYKNILFNGMQFAYKNRLFEIGDIHQGNIVNSRVVDYAHLTGYQDITGNEIKNVKTNRRYIPCNYLKK